MAGKGGRGNPVPVGDLAGAILDPVLRRRAGISMGLVQSWEDIVGPRLADKTRPERIAWPKHRHEDDPFEPAVLHVACEGFAALALQHETGEVIARINSFLGFSAIGRIKIVQKPVSREVKASRLPPRQLGADERARIEQSVAGIDDDGLREALERLGTGVSAARKPG